MLPTRLHGCRVAATRTLVRSATDVKSGGLRVLCGCDRLLVDAATEASLGEKRGMIWVNGSIPTIKPSLMRSKKV